MVDVDNRISNIISSGDGESDLYLTFTFDLNVPDVQEGTVEAKDRQAQLQARAEEAVAASIVEIREMVKGKA